MSQIDEIHAQLLRDAIGLSGGMIANIKEQYTGTTNFFGTAPHQVPELGHLPVKPDVSSTTPKALRLFRRHYVDKIYPLLDTIIVHHVPKTPSAASHFSILLNLLMQCYKNNYDDPFSRYVIALYNGLSYEYQWVNIEVQSLQKIFETFRSLSKRELKDTKELTRAILELELNGLDSTPHFKHSES